MLSLHTTQFSHIDDLAHISVNMVHYEKYDIQIAGSRILWHNHIQQLRKEAHLCRSHLGQSFHDLYLSDDLDQLISMRCKILDHFDSDYISGELAGGFDHASVGARPGYFLDLVPVQDRNPLFPEVEPLQSHIVHLSWRLVCGLHRRPQMNRSVRRHCLMIYGRAHIILFESHRLLHDWRQVVLSLWRLQNVVVTVEAIHALLPPPHGQPYRLSVRGCEGGGVIERASSFLGRLLRGSVDIWE